MNNWVIEFRNGIFLQNLAAERGVTRAFAMRFPSRQATTTFMDANNWIYFNGGMALELK